MGRLVWLTGLLYHGKGSDPEHQISNGIGDLCSTTPADGVASGGNVPDHAGFAPDLGDLVSVLHVLCPHAAPLIEGAPGGGLDSDAEGHEVRSFEL